eukprot:TRINITY_DN2654_c0_g1_i3.p1 TRINITY_DN2654_c0_g1~~TRINITY_DN2654_c0_g1_i3.p1  ORF type:complete len:225 (-),score=43.82 TRINITY_DN2654_c0_g1_i3:349-1023(-)
MQFLLDPMKRSKEFLRERMGLIVDTMKEAEIILKETIRVYENMDIPVLIWPTQKMCIAWISPAYRDLTGLELTSEELDYHDELDDEGLRQSMLSNFASRMAKLDLSIQNAVDFSFSCGIKNHRDVGPRYFKGTMSMKFKNAANGYPAVIVAVFLRSPETYKTDGLDWNALMNAFNQQLAFEFPEFGESHNLISTSPPDHLSLDNLDASPLMVPPDLCDHESLLM